ncbi:MAG TPA: hypothetical protein VJ724_10595, partial [Tahibacter sp.]|nr:hypothetical protein [Tahibacter sp.]
VERSTHAPVVAKAAAPAPRVAPQRIADVVSLPEVTVRPSAEDLALAHAEPVAASRAALPGPAKFTANASPRLAFDMPYYSFGKVLPQVSRE